MVVLLQYHLWFCSGLAGEIDTKFWDKYGMTLLFSTISAVAQVKFNTNKN
jgi:type IV secretory pathway VirB10-like protein